MAVPTMVKQSSPIKKSKNAKTERGRIWGSASTTKIGTVRKSHVTVPQNTKPADAITISFFFFDACRLKGVASRPTRKNKKVLPERVRQHLCSILLWMFRNRWGIVEWMTEAKQDQLVENRNGIITRTR